LATVCAEARRCPHPMRETLVRGAGMTGSVSADCRNAVDTAILRHLGVSMPPGTTTAAAELGWSPGCQRRRGSRSPGWPTASRRRVATRTGSPAGQDHRHGRPEQRCGPVGVCGERGAWRPPGPACHAPVVPSCSSAATAGLQRGPGPREGPSCSPTRSSSARIGRPHAAPAWPKCRRAGILPG